MSAYIVEIKAVALRDQGAVGFGVDERGRHFAVSLDLGLAADIATALDHGRRPIVAVEKPLQPPPPARRATVDPLVARRGSRTTNGRPQLSILR